MPPKGSLQALGELLRPVLGSVWNVRVSLMISREDESVGKLRPGKQPLGEVFLGEVKLRPGKHPLDEVFLGEVFLGQVFLGQVM